MLMKQILSKFSILMLMSFSCIREEVTHNILTVEDAYKTLVGEWIWIETVSINRINHTTHSSTPQSEGKTIHLVFNKENELDIIENDQQTNYRYSLVKDTGGIGFSSTFIMTKEDVLTNSKNVVAIQFPAADTLVFFDRSAPISWHYVRR